MMTYPPNPKYFLEDLEIGFSVESDSHTFTEQEILDFATQFDPIWIHTDPEAAKASFLGGLIASGWHTACIAQRLMITSFMTHVAGIISPGIEKLYFVKPVYVGDTIRVISEVIDSRPSASKPDRGLMRFKNEILNQKDEVVCTEEAMILVHRRPSN